MLKNQYIKLRNNYMKKENYLDYFIKRKNLFAFSSKINKNFYILTL